MKNRTGEPRKQTAADSSGPSRPGQGRTQASKEQSPGPRLPHEHDESADSQACTAAAGQGEVGRQAKKDLDRGLVDTDRGPVLDELYRNRVKR